MVEGSFRGADVEALLRTSSMFIDAVEQLQAIDLRTAAALGGLHWTGSDAQRYREAWDGEPAGTLHRAAAALLDAATRLVGEAEEQLVTSDVVGPTAAVSPTTSTPAGTSGSGTPGTVPTPADAAAGAATLRGRLTAWTDTAAAVLAPTADAVNGTTSTTTRLAIDAALLAGERLGVAERLAATGQTARFLDPVVGATGAGAAQALGVIGVGASLHQWHEGVREGDLTKEVTGGVSAALGTAALTGNPMAAGASVAWTGGTLIGQGINELKEGTEFDARFQGHMDRAFDAAGAAGMLATPVALAAAGVETGAAVAWEHGTRIGEGINALKEGTELDARFQQHMDRAFDTAGAAGMLATPAALAAAGVETAVDAVTDTVADTYERVEDVAIGAWRTITGSDDAPGATTP